MNQNQNALTTGPTAEARDLCLTYGKQPVLKNLDWKLMPGQVVGLLGRNGAGKTTLLETLLGLREPQSGLVQLLGAPANVLSDDNRARIGYVPQRSDLFEGFTATPWAGLGRLSAVKGLLGLALLIAVGGSIFAVQYYCHAQPLVLLAAACSASLALLNWRWMQVKRHPQAFPAGRLAS